MKRKEEIEQLADKSTIGVLPSHLDYRFIEVYKQFYIDGYKQCQEDMIEDLEMHVVINEHDWCRNPQAQLRDFIDPSNKQL